MTTANIIWSESDGGIENCVAIADGRRYDAWYIYDLVGITWGDKAETMRNCLKPNAPRFEVEFPDKQRRSYSTLAAARRAVERDADRRYNY